MPKSATYGVHSVYRLLYEERVDKLKHRMSYEFDADAAAADLTASWVVSGPTATTVREDIQSAIASKATDVRETIQEGIERGVSLDIPVVDGNTYGALRAVIDRQVDRKGFAALDPDDRRRIVRLATATLGTESGRCSPYALAEALLVVASTRAPTETLTTGDVAYGLAQLPAERLLPSLPPTMRKALKALLTADEPLGRGEIVERAGISESSYDRNIAELAAVGLVEATGNGGHKRWQAWLLPWWSPLANIDTPRTAANDDRTPAPASRWDDVLYRIALDLGLDPDYALFARPIDTNAVFAALPALDRWRGFLEAHYVLGSNNVLNDDENETDSGRRSTGSSLDASSTVEIGAARTNSEHEQSPIDAAE